MNWIDLILIVIVLLAMWEGVKTGFISGSVNLATLAGSIFLGFLTYPILSNGFHRFLPFLGIWASPLAFISSIIFFKILLSFLFKTILAETPEEANSSKLNKTLGIIPGFINGLIYVTLVSALIIALSFNNIFSKQANESELANRFQTNVQWLAGKVAPIFSPVIQKSFAHKAVESETNETVKLNYNLSGTKVRVDLETQMLKLVNNEREKRGLAALKNDTTLAVAGRAHARDMFARGYFSHYTPEGKDPFDRMKAMGIKFIYAGENLALGQTLSICHEGLMNSPGHKANILNPSFGRLGIGILDGGIYGLMIAQEFRN